MTINIFHQIHVFSVEYLHLHYVLHDDEENDIFQNDNEISHHSNTWWYVLHNIYIYIYIFAFLQIKVTLKTTRKIPPKDLTARHLYIYIFTNQSNPQNHQQNPTQRFNSPLRVTAGNAEACLDILPAIEAGRDCSMSCIFHERLLMDTVYVNMAANSRGLFHCQLRSFSVKSL